MVLYGDSITENWRGTSAGELWKWSNGTLDSRFVGWNMRGVFEAAFEEYRAGVMAIAGRMLCSRGTIMLQMRLYSSSQLTLLNLEIGTSHDSLAGLSTICAA